MRHPPVLLLQNSSPPTERNSLQSQDTYNTITRGRSPQANDWIGNLHFWKSLQNREGIDSLHLRGYREDGHDKKVG